MTDWAKHFQNVGFGADDVSLIQKRLNELGANPQLIVDGKSGPKTTAAIKAFQTSKGLTADGKVGPLTSAAMGLPAGTNLMGAVAKPISQADIDAYAIAKRAAAGSMTEKELQYCLTVAKGEGGYGRGWANPSEKTIALSKQFGLTGYEGKGSNNWGAVQGTGSAGSFPHVDHRADGTPYSYNYKRYNTPEEGFLDMARIILNGGKRGAQGAAEIKQAIAKGSLKDAVYAQRANGYFELAADKYLTAVMNNYASLTAGLKWPKLLTENKLAIGGGLAAIAAIALGWILFRRVG